MADLRVMKSIRIDGIPRIFPKMAILSKNQENYKQGDFLGVSRKVAISIIFRSKIFWYLNQKTVNFRPKMTEFAKKIPRKFKKIIFSAQHHKNGSKNSALLFNHLNLNTSLVEICILNGKLRLEKKSSGNSFYNEDYIQGEFWDRLNSQKIQPNFEIPDFLKLKILGIDLKIGTDSTRPVVKKLFFGNNLTLNPIKFNLSPINLGIWSTSSSDNVISISRGV